MTVTSEFKGKPIYYNPERSKWLFVDSNIEIPKPNFFIKYYYNARKLFMTLIRTFKLKY